MQYSRDILDSIRRILRALRTSSRLAESEMGVSGAQLLVLQILNAKKKQSINELADATQTHQSSVSTVVSRLEKADLIKRATSAEDARRTEVALTPKAVRLLGKRSPALAQEKLFAAVAKLPETKQKQLSALLQEVVENAGFAIEPASLFFEEDPS
jgi:DNA-binding MarR family transcriptional regulator